MSGRRKKVPCAVCWPNSHQTLLTSPQVWHAHPHPQHTPASTNSTHHLTRHLQAQSYTLKWGVSFLSLLSCLLSGLSGIRCLPGAAWRGRLLTPHRVTHRPGLRRVLQSTCHAPAMGAHCTRMCQPNVGGGAIGGSSPPPGQGCSRIHIHGRKKKALKKCWPGPWFTIFITGNGSFFTLTPHHN